MIKTKTGKILIMLVISIIMFNFISPNIVFARATLNQAKQIQQQQQQQQQTASQDPASNSSNSSSSSEANTNVRTRAGAEAYQQQQTASQDPAPDPSDPNANNPSQSSTSNTSSNNDSEKKIMNGKELTLVNAINEALPSVADGLVGIFSILLRAIIVAAGGAAQFLGSALGNSAGTTEDGSFSIITPDYILFNKLAITDINFFKMDTFGSTNKALDGNNNPIKLLKENVATWYTTLRALSTAILLVILIYIGIRMVIASTGEGKGKYKKMLMNWLTSFEILFLLNYIILLFINVNNALLDMLAGVAGKSGVGGYGEYVTQLAKTAIISTSGTAGIASAWLYLIITVITLIFLFMYVKRMLTIAFLILVSPIITITYSIDKVKDSKSQAFDNWFKEFWQNVLIQPFHCVIYIAFVSSSIDMLSKDPTVGGAILVIITTIFIFVAEGMLKSIFSIKAESLGNGMGTTIAIWGLARRLEPSGKAKTPPSNVGTKKGGGNTPSTNPKSPSMVATNNLNQSNNAQSNSGNSSPNIGSNSTNNRNIPQTKSDSEKLADRMLNPNVAAEDYDTTMNDRPDKTPEQKRADAMADDYDELMGNNDMPSETATIASEPGVPRQKIYAGLGNVQPEYKDGMKRQKIYGGLGSLPQQSNNSNNVTPSGNVTQSVNTNNNSNSSNQEIKMPDVKNNNPSLGKMALNGAKAAGNFVVKGNKLLSKAGGYIVGSTFAGLQGANPADVAGSAIIGKHVQDNIENKVGSGKEKVLHTISDVKIKNDEKTLATAFSNYKNGRDYDRGTDINQARNYLNMDSNKIKEIKDISERQYVQALHAMRNIYNKDKYNDEDPNERVMETMEKIVEKEIEPKNY